MLIVSRGKYSICKYNEQQDDYIIMSDSIWLKTDAIGEKLDENSSGEFIIKIEGRELICVPAFCLKQYSSVLNTMKNKIIVNIGKKTVKRRVNKRIVESRVDRKTLDDVCLDCCDFLNYRCVECEDCPVSYLKKRLKCL